MKIRHFLLSALLPVALTGCGSDNSGMPGVESDMVCAFAAELSGGPPGETFAGKHEGTAHNTGNAMTLRDPKTGWSAIVELPKNRRVGTFTGGITVSAIKATRADGRETSERWQGEAEIVISAVKDREFIEGSLSGDLESRTSGDYQPFHLSVSRFRSVPFSVRADSPQKRCTAAWDRKRAG